VEHFHDSDSRTSSEVYPNAATQTQQFITLAIEANHLYTAPTALISRVHLIGTFKVAIRMSRRVEEVTNQRLSSCFEFFVIDRNHRMSESDVQLNQLRVGNRSYRLVIAPIITICLSGGLWYLK
jgi:hypothetical protein